jgi:hypothetical protein
MVININTIKINLRVLYLKCRKLIHKKKKINENNFNLPYF